MRLIRHSQIFSHTRSKRPIWIHKFGCTHASLRILIVAGQHGDEQSVILALREHFHTLCNWEEISLTIVPMLNPEGVAVNGRLNGDGIDLNRDHQRLNSHEVRALHQLVAELRPHLIIDLHSYPARRKHLLAQNLIYCHDLFLDVPNNPAQQSFPWSHNRLIQSFEDWMENRGFIAGRYTLVRPSGRVRHSTPDVVDARNGLTLRFDIPTFLLEDREPLRSEGEEGKLRQRAAIGCGLGFLVDWAKRNQLALNRPHRYPQSGDQLTIRSRYRSAAEPKKMRFYHRKRKSIETVTLPGKYSPHIEAGSDIRLPAAYAVPRSLTKLVALLQAHRFRYAKPACLQENVVERFYIQAVTHSKQKGRPPRQIAFETKC